MKSVIFVLTLLLMVPQMVRAADPLKVAPDMYSLLFENDQVRVMKVVFKPGQKIAEHSHPDHYVVVSHPGKLKITKKDGTSTDVELKTNEVLWIPAETHWAQNTGTTEVELIVNEMKPKKMG